MNVQQLKDLDDDEFKDEVSENLGFGSEHWHLFADGQVVRRTAEVLEEILASLDMQLAKYAGQDAEWEVRASNLRKMVSVRLKQAHRRIHNADGTEAYRAKQWRAVLHEVAEALEESDLAAELDEIEIPFDGLTVRQWLARRREKRGVAA